MDLIITALVSGLVSVMISALVAKAIAAHYFKVLDSYVQSIIEIAKEQIKKAYLNRDRH